MNIHHIIKSKSFQSDGRLQKWIDCLSKYSIDSTVLIIEDNNKIDKIFLGKTQIKKIKLFSRYIFKKQKGYYFKVPEYGFRFLCYILKENPKVVVFHDVQQYLNILITLIIIKPFRKTKIIWDMHELPHPILSRNSVLRWIVKFILSNCDLLIYTNKERREYTLKVYKHREIDYFILNNYPDKDFINSDVTTLTETVNKWLKGEPYILWLGAAIEGRNFNTFFSSYLKYRNKFKLIILGKIDTPFEKEIKTLREEGRVLVDYVKQSELINFIDNAFFSVVLYNTSSPNNLYCEPNRLYQLISRGVPIICGNNPTMYNIVNEIKGGVILTDDGISMENMDNSFTEMINNHQYYKQNLKNNGGYLSNWEDQFDKLYNNKFKNGNCFR